MNDKKAKTTTQHNITKEKKTPNVGTGVVGEGTNELFSQGGRKAERLRK